MIKKSGAILTMMLFAVSVFGAAPGMIDAKRCHGIKTYVHTKCLIDSAYKAKLIVSKKPEVKAKKICKTEPKSIFSGLFSFEFPTLPLEDFVLSAQKALIEKFS